MFVIILTPVMATGTAVIDYTALVHAHGMRRCVFSCIRTYTSLVDFYFGLILPISCSNSSMYMSCIEMMIYAESNQIPSSAGILLQSE